ncbi:MAG: HNH endonuclease signature motif containing protein [Chloroflexi bacterium]|nr:HNH endonuclease signature motif containing protein [Chloroflexota bacterium]MCY3581571.1 HNH endonuclease signature motif containing protein [Chloroflexota bacterium]MCY3717677.1 HNH endonuclease signature motif containing protein [Chloroflexota bacterium]MDE2649742.1 HNH endonuclease signature motif containing protein [Chloroflexota bacterium]
MTYQDQLDFTALRQYASALKERAKQAGAAGDVSATMLRDRILESGGRCEWCGRNLAGMEFELDHVLSLAQGGGNTPSNLVVACPSCNRRKAAKHPARFAVEIISETGARTELVERILARYRVEPSQQLPLFAAYSTSGESTQREPAHKLDGVNPPPYRWED